MSSVIDQAVQARLIATAPRSQVIPASLRYDRADPFAVRLIFPPAASLDGAEVTWTFARELLEEGLCEPAGAGDVQIWPYDTHAVVVEFHAVGGMAVVQFEAQELRTFLTRSYRIVAKGEEARHLDVEADLVALLREA
ncbi:SsgA family sporulation/cell division regulator [Streptomyces lydicus]|uniref:SsgA family sporulation/cell division regulator n=1 Tax=Streptomyces lydicus TaxID=47763 RepID=UPI0010105088|nr:SsgA family sporulation/cell division regulator [Streptomyces lydicus]MCZ1006217.1 SsgA family sporulation/cell division regulator [Streptomyces lydicus]